VSLASFIGFGLSFDPPYPVVTNYRAHQFLVAHYHLSDPILSRYWH
jgi:hypothetical protein